MHSSLDQSKTFFCFSLPLPEFVDYITVPICLLVIFGLFVLGFFVLVCVFVGHVFFSYLYQALNEN